MHVLAQQATGSLLSLWPLLAVGAVFWFLVIRPQRKRQAERDQMLKTVEVGSEVVTIGGLFGEVEAIDDAWVDLLVSEDVVLRFARSAIGRIATDEDQATLEAFASGESLRDDDHFDDDELVEDDAHRQSDPPADHRADPPADHRPDHAAEWPEPGAADAERTDR